MYIHTHTQNDICIHIYVVHSFDGSVASMMWPKNKKICMAEWFANMNIALYRIDTAGKTTQKPAASRGDAEEKSDQ